MCRLCAVAPLDFEIPPLKSKFNPERYLNKTIPVRRGEFVLEEIRNYVKDPFEQLALYDLFLASLSGQRMVADRSPSDPPPAFVEGVSAEIIAFEKALTYLERHNPTRMKTLEQLEQNYHKSVQTVKQQRAAALSSLHTRQALEMDMITSQAGGYEKSELKALVNQHVSEMDSIHCHWEKEVRGTQQRQLKEYKELVQEVFESEKGKVSSPQTVKKRIYKRAQLAEAEFVRMMPLAVRPDLSRPVRVIRSTEFKGDFISSIFSRNIVAGRDSPPDLDPEEQCCLVSSHVKSAAIIGIHPDEAGKKKSNQYMELLDFVDSVCPTDCRYPSLSEQLAHVGSSLRDGRGVAAVTRHSNLGNGVSIIFHLLECNQEIFKSVLGMCDCLGIERIFAPHIIVPDLRVPSVTGMHPLVQPLLISAARQLSNFISNPSLDELVVIYP